MEDQWWDLNAVVRSCGATASSWLPAKRDPFSSFPQLAPSAIVKAGEKEVASSGGSYLGFQDLLESGRRGGFQELEELFKPFVPGVQKRMPAQGGIPSPPVAVVTAATASTVAAGPHQPSPPAPVGMGKQAQRSLSHAPRSKRRKNQQKKVVCHVPADGLSSDMWAWRKYGQKPIKGSPYPRGYYRCSSSKGCLARKQVERSRVDPAMFIITYTAEHNHPMPTHRNSLAGITRNKFPPSSSAGANAAASSAGANAVSSAGDSSVDNPSFAQGNPASSPLSSSTATGLSPTTPLTASMEDELLCGHPPGSSKEEDAPGDEEDEDEDVQLSVEDMEVMGEDDLLFMPPDEVPGDVSGSGTARSAAAFFDEDARYGDYFFSPSPWLSSTGGSNAAAAAGGS